MALKVRWCVELRRDAKSLMNATILGVAAFRSKLPLDYRITAGPGSGTATSVTRNCTRSEP
ncbi:hypothetical protein V1279_002881 [Bradyrhizobium sp. AZCC 1610]